MASNWIVTLRGTAGSFGEPEVHRIDRDQIDRYQEISLRVKDASIVADVRMVDRTRAEAIEGAPMLLFWHLAAIAADYGGEA